MSDRNDSEVSNSIAKTWRCGLGGSLLSSSIVINHPHRAMRKPYLAIVVALLVATSGAWATTVVYVASACGMAVGADGKTVPSGTAVKIALLKQRLVVADLYYERATASDGSTVYDFSTWIQQIDNATDADISVTGLVEVIKKQMPSTFSFASEVIKNGTLTKKRAQVWGAGEYFVQYVIAGYENGVPLVYSLTLIPD